MFGIIYTLSSLFLKSIGVLKEDCDNKYIKRNQNDNDLPTWTDIRGNERLKSNGHIAVYGVGNKSCPNDYTLTDIQTGRIIKNYSSEDRDSRIKNEYEKRKQQGYSTYCCDFNNHLNDSIKGRRYKDFNTGQVFVIRDFCFRYYYVDILTGVIVRETDYQIKNNKKYTEEYLIKQHNYITELNNNMNKSFYNENYDSNCNSSY